MQVNPYDYDLQPGLGEVTTRIRRRCAAHSKR